jgi:diguanylate cyclase (GGDEF)-like protein
MPRSAKFRLVSRLYALASAVVVFVLILGIGEVFLRTQTQEAEDAARIEAISRAATLRARVERELNALLFISSGLGGYLVVRNDRIQAKEVNDILSVLYRNARHVRNFGIAVGYRLTYVYPLAGNEKAIGLHYPDQAEQWPMIRRIVESGTPALAGPLELVQGGSGLVYRVPLSIDGRYWGLLSTVIDADSFFKAIFAESAENPHEFAIRGKDGLGMKGDAIWGDMGLFARPGTVIQEIEIPGGHWIIAVGPKTSAYQRNLSLVVRLISIVLGGLIAWMMHMLMRNRSELADLAMYDALTGLPNRHLMEDRTQMALARQRRHPEQLCAMLFFDLDGFKDINDRHGHKAGDAVLRATAERARATVRRNDTVARWGGDEFIVLLEEVSQGALDTLQQRLRDEIEAPIEFEGLTLRVGVSIGVAIYPDNGANLDDMVKIADRGMYLDKTRRKSGE